MNSVFNEGRFKLFLFSHRYNTIDEVIGLFQKIINFLLTSNKNIFFYFFKTKDQFAG